MKRDGTVSPVREVASPVAGAGRRSAGSGKRARIVVLVSGAGSNLQVLLDACAAGDLPGEVVGVVSDRPACPAVERARAAGVAVEALSPAALREAGGTRDDYDGALAETVAFFKPDLIVMAGFMRVLSAAFLERFPADRIVNLHPALLPENPTHDRVTLPDDTDADVLRGHDAVAKALAAGVKWTGASIHYVTAEVDRGPLLARRAVRVEPGDTVETLRERIQAAEHVMLPHVLAAWLSERGFSGAPR